MAKTHQVVAEATDAFNAHDEQRIRSHYADDVIVEAPGGVRLQGAETAAEYVMGWLRAFPDGQIRIETEVADGEWVAQRFVFEGTHEQTLVVPEGDIPATHRRLTAAGMEFYRVQDDKIVEDRVCFDQVEVLTQLGLMPELAVST